MSKNNMYQNKNEKRNNRDRGDFNNKKSNKQPKVNYNKINVPLYLAADLNENIIEEIIDVLAGTKFNKISIPLGTYRCLVDNNTDVNDSRICTIGYINNYNESTKEFTVVIYNNFINTVKEFNNPVIDIKFTIHEDKLGTIVKFNVIPTITEECIEEN